MSHLILVTGGVRSGKSRMAEQLLSDSERVLYIATARCLDDEMKRRIDIHQQSRPSHWITAEASSELDQVLAAHPVGDILLDCVANMVTNLMLDAEPDYDGLSMSRIEEIEQHIGDEFTAFLDKFREQNRTAVLVTNEVGLSLVSTYRMGRIFTDILGRLNQRLAAESDEVYLLTCGIPLHIK
jgi:adenosylcobinamide kinase/adenosylcobinamide-phosphate guanylyltransferase